MRRSFQNAGMRMSTGRGKRKNWAWVRILLPVSVAILLSSSYWLPSYGWADKEGRSPQSQPEGYVSSVPKTIVDLQPFRQASSIEIKDEQGEEGLASLINLNTHINASYLIQVKWRKNGIEEAYQLENPDPRTQTLLLDKNQPTGIIIAQGGKNERCDLWGTGAHSSLKQAKVSGAAYAPLCGGKLYLRNPTRGHQTGIERVSDFLRDKVPGGEEIVSFVRDRFFTYIYREKAEERPASSHGVGPPSQEKTDNYPVPALIDPKQANRMVKAIDLGIEIEGASSDDMIPGTWYAAKDNPGIYISVIVPNGIATEVMRSFTNVVNGLDRVEFAELFYLIAFDLGRFNVHYALGTGHPRVGWSSEHILNQMRDRSLPGPDGIGTIAPLVSTGLISPMDAGRTAAAFTGGFKREHGAFKYGPLALKNHGSHYGFLENGVLFSKLQPGLSTLYVLEDGWAEMKTWTEEDNHLLPRIRYARQNGVPIITEYDPSARISVPGPFISRWGDGNWSGSEDKKLQTMRAGAALQEFRGKRFLIYAFFWSATPSAMARVFQAYQCRYAMLLDMNALVHTYLAIYRRQGSNLYVQHLIKGMHGADMSVKGQRIPRFLGYPDDRDFFYLTEKEIP